MPELNFNILAQQGPQNFMQGYAQGNELRNRMAQQRQQEQLADLQVQNALREQRMAGEEEAAYKAAGGDMARLQQELMGRGLGKQSMAVGAQISKQQADRIAMLKQQHDLVKTAAAQVMANPEAAVQTLTAFGHRTGIDMNDDLAQVQALGGDPAKIKQWAAGIALEADKLLPQLNTRDIGGQIQDRRYNPVTGQIEIIGTTAKTITPDAIAADARARQDLAFRVSQASPEAIQARAKAEAQGRAAGEGDGILKATEGERKAATLLGILQNAEVVIDTVSGKKSQPGPLSSAVPSALKNEDRQRMEAAQLDFLDAALTLSTGAAYTKEQLEGKVKTYFPQYGDKKETLADKAKRRGELVEMARIAAGRAAGAIKQPTPKPEPGGAFTQQQPASKPPAGIDAALWNVMTPQERALWQK